MNLEAYVALAGSHWVSKVHMHGQGKSHVDKSILGGLTTAHFLHTCIMDEDDPMSDW